MSDAMPARRCEIWESSVCQADERELFGGTPKFRFDSLGSKLMRWHFRSLFGDIFILVVIIITTTTATMYPKEFLYRAGSMRRRLHCGQKEHRTNWSQSFWAHVHPSPHRWWCPASPLLPGRSFRKMTTRWTLPDMIWFEEKGGIEPGPWFHMLFEPGLLPWTSRLAKQNQAVSWCQCYSKNTPPLTQDRACLLHVQSLQVHRSLYIMFTTRSNNSRPTITP